MPDHPPHANFREVTDGWIAGRPSGLPDQRRPAGGKGARTSPAAFALLLAAGSIVGCDDARPPAPPGVPGRPGARDGLLPGPAGDGGPGALPDGAPPPAGQPPRGPDDDEPVLPSADLEVVLPYEGPTEVVRLSFAAEVARLDVQINVDTTGSIQQEIDALQDTLSERIVPELRGRVPGTFFGVSRFEDFPEAPFGADGDRPFALVTPVTGNLGAVENAVASLDRPLGNGGDLPESGAEALYQIATGEGWGRRGDPGFVPPFDGPGAAGGVGFREDALRAIVHVTDAPTHGPASYGDDFPGTRSLEEAIAALVARDVRVLGIASDAGARPYLEDAARGTGATFLPGTGDGSCPTGLAGAPRPADADGRCPLVFDVDEDGAGLADTILDALVGLLGGIAFDEVRGVARGDRLRFLARAFPEQATPPAGFPAPEEVDDPPGDGSPDALRRVTPGTMTTFAFELRNDVIREADYEQVFRLTLEVQGDGVTLVEERVRVRIPIAGGTVP